MFKNIFSFKGKISGIELLISWIIGLVIIISIFVYIDNHRFSEIPEATVFFIDFGFLGLSYFLLSQTIKGCRLIDENMFLFKNERIRRTEYGLSWVIWVIIYLIVALMYLPLVGVLGSQEIEETEGMVMLVIIMLFWFASHIFLLIQSIKRCHDFNESGWLSIIPIYNPFWLLFAEGTKGKNRFGNDPKQSKIDKKVRNYY